MNAYHGKLFLKFSSRLLKLKSFNIFSKLDKHHRSLSNPYSRITSTVTKFVQDDILYFTINHMRFNLFNKSLYFSRAQLTLLYFNFFVCLCSLHFTEVDEFLLHIKLFCANLNEHSIFDELHQFSKHKNHATDPCYSIYFR